MISLFLFPNFFLSSVRHGISTAIAVGLTLLLSGPNPHKYPAGVSLYAILLLLYRVHGTRIQRQGEGIQNEETVLRSKVTKFFNSH